MEYSKEFVTSVVLGKDLVPRYSFRYGRYSVIYGSTAVLLRLTHCFSPHQTRSVPAGGFSTPPSGSLAEK